MTAPEVARSHELRELLIRSWLSLKKEHPGKYVSSTYSNYQVYTSFWIVS